MIMRYFRLTRKNILCYYRVMNIWKNEKYIHRLFDISLIFKGILATIETIGGFLALFISTQFITDFVITITQDELSDDPTDFFSNFLVHSAHQLSIGSQHYIAFYLLSHGIIKAFLVTNLFKEKLWAFPAAIGVFSLFGAYQIVEYILHGSVWLLILTVLDAIVIMLTWHEYNYIKKTGVKPTWE